MKKALFLDRDGTLIRDKNYLHDPEQVELIPGVAEALRRAVDLGYLLFLFTNQSGIGRNYFTWEDCEKVNRRMEELMGLPRPVFTEVCIAPEKPDDVSIWRKPSPRFIVEMIGKHDLDPAMCYMVGDTRSDIAAGINAGITSVAVATGKGEHPREFPEVASGAVRVYETLGAFVDRLAHS